MKHGRVGLNVRWRLAAILDYTTSTQCPSLPLFDSTQGSIPCTSWFNSLTCTAMVCMIQTLCFLLNAPLFLFSIIKLMPLRMHDFHVLVDDFNSLLVLFLLQSLTPLMFRSLVRLLTSLIGEPVASVSTLLYYSDLLPQTIVLERLVRHEFLQEENYLFHFLINFLRCFWWIHTYRAS